MKLRLLGVLAALSLFAIHSAARADVAWETDYQRAVTLSHSTGKPLFIDIYTDWCGWCKKLDAEVYPDARVQQMSRSFVMLKLNAEGRDARYAQAIKPRGYPALYFVSPRDQRMVQVGGYIDTNTFTSRMQQALEREAALRQATPKTSTPPKQTTSATVPAAVKRAASPQKPLDWRSQPNLRKLASQKNSGGVFLLDDSGVVPLDAPAKKTVAKSKKRVAR